MGQTRMRIRVMLAAVMTLLCLASPSFEAFSWDEVSENPFPGVPYGEEIPNLSKLITCSETPQIPDDCVKQGGGQVVCPAWSANQITPTTREDGSWATAKSWCRNSWLPPTTAADDQDFRNRQDLAVAQATAESQAWNAANPGLQKCVTWGPIVHRNGVSTASGGVCANPVGTRSDGTTAQVAPSPVGSTNQPATSNSESSTSSASSPNSQGGSTSEPPIDYAQYGIGKPFTKVVPGSTGTAGCPSGFRAASNYFEWLKATECWPQDAWIAYSKGGSTWTAFKDSNGGTAVQAQLEREMRINATRTLALRQAQELSGETPGLRRCVTWNVFDQQGSECAFVPRQSVNIGRPSTPDSTGTLSPLESSTVVTSPKGITLAEWADTDEFTNLSCAIGYEKKSELHLAGTVESSDDFWTTSCVKSALLVSSDSPSSTNGQEESTSATMPTNGEVGQVSSDSGVANIPVADSAAAVAIQIVQVEGTSDELITYAVALETDDVAVEIQRVVGTFIKAKQSKKGTFKVEASDSMSVSYTSLTPRRCLIRVNGRDAVSATIATEDRAQIVPMRKGSCEIQVVLASPSGNEYKTTRSYQIKSGKK